MPNSGFAQIWLQRMLKDNLNKFKFTEKICELQNNQINLWNYSWVKGKNMLNMLNNTSIFLQAEFDKLDNIIPKFMSTANEFLQFLFDINVICYIETPEGGDKPYFHWCFKDRNYANISPKVKSGVEYQVFYGLTKALDLGTAFKR